MGARLNLGAIALSDDRTCRLTFDKETAVDIEEAQDPDYFHLYSVIAAIPADAEPTLRRLLAANLFGQGTGQAVFSVDPETDEILLTRTLRADDTSPEVFIEALESFVHHAEHWKKELSRPFPVEPSTTEGAPAPPPGPGHLRV